MNTTQVLTLLKAAIEDRARTAELSSSCYGESDAQREARWAKSEALREVADAIDEVIHSLGEEV